MTTLYLVRHGETEWNNTNRYQGDRDIPLNAKGEEQAGKIACRLRKVDLDAVFSSDLGRAAETARAINAGRNLPFFMRRGLREMNYGLWEGLTKEEIMERYLPAWRDYQQDSLEARVPEGETYQDVLARVRKVLDEIAEKLPEGTAALVGHSGSLRAVIFHALEMNPRNRWRLRLANVSLSVVTYGAGVGELLLFNDTCHLAEDPLEDAT